MMMQWFINEVNEKFEKMNQRIEGLGKNEDLIERITKLEGEIKAMKARMGKQQKQQGDHGLDER
jgi:chaperonin cofactor prefoldin